MCPGDRHRNGQSQAGTVAVCWFRSAEALEGVRQELVRDPGAFIGHVELNRAVARLGRERDAAVAMTDGVVDEVAQGLLEPVLVCLDHKVTAGVGLGLALARRLARAAGGDVELGDEELGACFIVRLPIA
jgi:nitrogen-specific signal transduction histidine kinase